MLASPDFPADQRSAFTYADGQVQCAQHPAVLATAPAATSSATPIVSTPVICSRNVDVPRYINPGTETKRELEALRLMTADYNLRSGDALRACSQMGCQPRFQPRLPRDPTSRKKGVISK